MFRVIENFVSTGTEIQISDSDSSANNEPKQEKGGAKLLKDFLKDFRETLSLLRALFLAEHRSS